MIKDLKAKISVFLRCMREKKKDKEFYLSKNIFPTEILEISKKIRENGYFVIKGYYDKYKCNLIINEIKELINSNPDKLDVDNEMSDFRFFSIHKLSKYANEFYKDPFLLQNCESYLEAQSVNNFTLGARLIAKENNQGSGGGWHRDSEYEKQFKSIIYLTDVTEDNGPFQIIEKSNTLRNVISLSGYNKSKRYSNENVESYLKSSNLKLKTLTGEAGDLILVDTRSIHRGMPIKSGERYALTNYFSTKNRVGEFENYFNEVNKI